jgi:hypothetical protein
MDDDALATYLNDHLGGAAFGSDLARKLESEGDDGLKADMAQIAPQIEEDRESLAALVDKLDMTQNPVKQATGWVAEKVGRVKLSGLSSGDSDLGTFLSLEALSLGIEGKRSLWLALQEIAGSDSRLTEVDLVRLTERAEAQREVVERHRREFARRALAE